GLVGEVAVLPLALPVALGRVVINAPRTSSSWAIAIAGIRRARAIRKLSKMIFILISETYPPKSILTTIIVEIYLWSIRTSNTTGASEPFADCGTFTLTKGRVASLLSTSVIGSLV